MTYRELYDWGTIRLNDADIAEAALDARLLLEYVCHTDRNALLAHGERPVEAVWETAYRSLVEDRACHIPLQQILHSQEFMGIEFYVNQNVLIPRQDTEILVEEVMREPFDGARILDLCTGSGCILLSLLHYSNGSTGTGVDLSKEALAVAKENADRLGLQERTEWIESDLFTQVSGRYDLLVSNPPYIRRDVIGTLAPEVREHEPLMALDGGEDGLMFYREILKKAPVFLYPGARIYLEIGYDQAAEVTALMKQNGVQEIRVVQDYAGLDRVVCGILEE